MQTESINKNTVNLDGMSSSELVSTFINEDKQLITALEKARAQIAKAIDLSYESLKKGGRLFYFGAGTSGRLGVLDASECPPTFSTDPEMVQGIIAGGDTALRNAVEGAEDDTDAGYNFVKENCKKNDIVIGISASGSAPYVIGTLKAANDLKLANIAIANNNDAESFKVAKAKIFLDTGAEVLSGSTRLKAGTSQKMVLNIISTSVMVKLGKVYGNLMVDLTATNKKLVKRATKLVEKITKCSEAEAVEALEKNQMRVKEAVLYRLKGLSFDEAQSILAKNNGFLGKCLD